MFNEWFNFYKVQCSSVKPLAEHFALIIYHIQIIAEAPQVSILSVQASYNEGSFVNISCTASGKPDPDVQWIRNGMILSSGQKTAFLTFGRINRTDDGQYTCRGNNSAGNNEKHSTLVVHCK